MDESITRNLAIKEKKPSEWLREGIPLVEETHDSFSGCAIGTIYFAKTGISISKESDCFSLYDLQKAVGLPWDLFLELNTLHFNHRINREQAADMLEKAGY